MSNQLTKYQLSKLHENSSMHRQLLILYVKASCFHCAETFPRLSIKRWTDCGQTALCPKCDIDAVLPGEYPVDVLEQMRQQYFCAWL